MSLDEFYGSSNPQKPAKKDDYEEHKAIFGLKYSAEEDPTRKANFLRADALIKAHNADPSKTSKLAHNQLSTLNESEKKRMRGAVPPNENRQRIVRIPTTHQPSVSTAEAVTNKVTYPSTESSPEAFNDETTYQSRGSSVAAMNDGTTNPSTVSSPEARKGETTYPSRVSSPEARKDETTYQPRGSSVAAMKDRTTYSATVSSPAARKDETTYQPRGSSAAAMKDRTTYPSRASSVAAMNDETTYPSTVSSPGAMKDRTTYQPRGSSAAAMKDRTTYPSRGSSTEAKNDETTYSSTIEEEEEAMITTETPNPENIRKKRTAEETTTYPSSLDWRCIDGTRDCGACVNGTDYLAPIQNQGDCGSCWTFSATASLESRLAIVNGEAVPKLSEQNLVDCCHTGSTSSNNCDGGWYTTAWSYVASNKGFSVGAITGTNSAALPKPYVGQNYLTSYPYTGKGGQSCKFNEDYIGGSSWYYNTPDQYYKRSASHSIEANSPAAFKQALQSGPISVAIDASGHAFEHYSSGTLQASDCNTTLDHAVNVIGYGSDSNGLYWLMRNSWGTTWGESGYMKFQRTDEEGWEGTCGVLKAAAYPNVVKDE